MGTKEILQAVGISIVILAGLGVAVWTINEALNDVFKALHGVVC